MTNKQIARTLKETARLIELTGGNPFRARAFSGGARAVEQMEEPVAEALAAGTLTQHRGIGAGLSAQIAELVETGSFGLRDELLAEVPPGLRDVLRVQGLGVKRARQLWQELGVTSLEDLEVAAETGRIAALEGFGKRMQAQTLEHVRLLKQYRSRRRYADAVLLAAPVLERLRAQDAVARAEPTGALRRKLETVAAVDLLVATEDPGGVRRALSEWIPEAEPSDEAPSDEAPSAAHAFLGTLPDGFPLRVHFTPADRFGTALWEHTGAPDHLEAFRAAFGDPAPTAEEQEIYDAAGLPFIAPELREGLGELEAARRGRLPELITTEDLRGSLHNHSTYSDGTHTLRQMAEAARALGLSYLGICDHSRSLTIAGGMSIDEVRAQQEEIRTLNEELGADGLFRIFSGIESDILTDGALDYPEDVLASFDFVVASVHSGFNMTVEEATDRVVRAVENPYTTILGHATGRLLLAREGYPLDYERVIAACAAHDVAIEMNANPYRLDMDWRWIRTATDQGVLISINPDAHSTGELENVRWGVAAARKGWLAAAQCLNAKPLEAFTDWLETRRAERISGAAG